MKVEEKPDTWLGIDGGSTTVKLSLVDAASGQVLYSRYERHDGEPRQCLARLLTAVPQEYQNRTCVPIFTGSQCRPLAEGLGSPYVQEVIAGSLAVKRKHPEVRTVVELGGQDAKIIFLTSDGRTVSDMRMNGVCAGGTGAFIDQMAALLAVAPEDFNGLAAQGAKIYEISGRCGVFAKTDIQPLLNQGVSPADIALSCFHALAKQTIGGLAQGMAIVPGVLLAGGPFGFNPVLRQVFRQQLCLSEEKIFLPEDPACFVAYGAALAVETPLGQAAPAFVLGSLTSRLHEAGLPKEIRNGGDSAPRFFTDETERLNFAQSYTRRPFVPRLPGNGGRVPVYIGLDAGSTTTKFVVTDTEGEPLYTFYRANEGKPLDTARQGLLELFEACSRTGTELEVRGLGTTGYGEELFAAAFGADIHTVETLAHKEAACRYEPEVSFILDVGGQDMKAITLRNGIITNIVLNEACSAGCGSFIETYAKSLGVSAPDIAPLAFEANDYPVLGSRCTVFMNSSIISEQKQGRSRAELLGGVCASVVENLFTKVLRIANPEELGPKIVVQGGTFRNDAVLKAFIDRVGRPVTRPDLCGEMGAYGAALLALKEREPLFEQDQAPASRFLGYEGLRSFSYETLPAARCDKCANNCELRMVRFPSGLIHTTGNRCDRGLPEAAAAKTEKKDVPDLWKERTKMLLSHSRLEAHKVRRNPEAPKVLGLPLVLDFFDSLPFWTHYLTHLGCKILLSGTATPALLNEGLADVSSDTVCLPAKVVHGHVRRLLKRGCDQIFFPKMLKLFKEQKDADDSWNCAVVQGYPEVVRISLTRKGEDPGKFLSPAFKWTSPLARRRQLISFAVTTFGVSPWQARLAIAAGDRAQNRFRSRLRQAGQKVLRQLRETGQTGVVLAGRPYHGDPFVSHGLSGLITSLGVPVLVNDALKIRPRPLKSFSRIDTTNVFHTRLVSAAREIAQIPELQMIQVVSFGCGHDAVLTDELQRILREYGSKELLSLKLDEGENSGPLRIRLRSFLETVRTRGQNSASARFTPPLPPFVTRFLKQDKKQRTILIPQLSESFSELMSHAFRLQGYKTRPLNAAGPAEVALGKRYVHNDICYPAQLNIGEILGYLTRHKDQQALLAGGVAKNCNDCRAGQYAALARKALDAAGFPEVPLITSDLKDTKNLHPGFQLKPLKFQRFMIKGLALIDALDEMARKCRPYERQPGAVMTLWRRWLHTILEALEKQGFSAALLHLKTAVAGFNALDLDRSQPRPRVGIIGEILVNFHDRGNHGVVRYLEANGMEVVLPAMLEFWRQDVVNLHHATKQKHVRNRWAHRLLALAQEFLFGRAFQAVDQILQDFRFYESRPDIRELAALAQQVTDISFKTGEGWLMPGEILSWIKKGLRSFLVVQPFGCLPNHITGRGILAAIKQQHEDVQILPLDFDPDTSEANIQNRLQMLILSAREREAAAAAPSPAG